MVRTVLKSLGVIMPIFLLNKQTSEAQRLEMTYFQKAFDCKSQNPIHMLVSSRESIGH